MKRFPIMLTPNDTNTKILTDLQARFEELYDAMGAQLAVTRDVSIAITKLDEAWLWLCKATQ